MLPEYIEINARCILMAPAFEPKTPAHAFNPAADPPHAKALRNTCLKLRSLGLEDVRSFWLVRMTNAMTSDGKDIMWLVNTNIDLDGKNLTRLPDLRYVILKGDFICTNNALKNLVGAPYAVKNVKCTGNKGNMTSLQGAPEMFDMIDSDLGKFTSRDDVLRICQERAELVSHQATVLQRSLPMKKKLTLREKK